MSYYLNTKNWELSNEPTEGSKKISTPLVFALMPILGGLFVVFLPAIGFAVPGYYAVMAIRKALEAKRNDGHMSAAPSR